MTYAYLGSADLSDMVEMEMGRVVVICSQSTEILYIKTWDFFFIMSKFCSVLCDEVHCEYWNYQIWFYSDVNSFFWFSICSDKIVHELLQKPSKKFLHKVNILLRNHVLVFLFKKKKRRWAVCVNTSYASLWESKDSAVGWLPAGCRVTTLNQSWLVGRWQLACNVFGAFCCLCTVRNSYSGKCVVGQCGHLELIPLYRVRRDSKSLWVSDKNCCLVLVLNHVNESKKYLL